MPEDDHTNHVRAYVLIETKPEMARSVVQSLQKRPDIRSVDAINGPFNVIAVVERDSASSMATAILVEIKKLPGVADVIVYLAEPKEEWRLPPTYLSNFRVGHHGYKRRVG
jgi:nitrate reductase NapAB chaperone NapD